MAIIPTLRCRSMRKSIAFYTEVLDFERVDGDDELNDPSFSVLSRDSGHLFLSSHGGDGVFGAVVAVTTNDVDALFRTFVRGLDNLAAASYDQRQLVWRSYNNDVVLCNAYFVFSTTTKAGVTTVQTGRESSTLVKSGGKWLIANQHYSAMF